MSDAQVASSSQQQCVRYGSDTRQSVVREILRQMAPIKVPLHTATPSPSLGPISSRRKELEGRGNVSCDVPLAEDLECLSHGGWGRRPGEGGVLTGDEGRRAALLRAGVEGPHNGGGDSQRASPVTLGLHHQDDLVQERWWRPLW